jgi:hypothetical protein
MILRSRQDALTVAAMAEKRQKGPTSSSIASDGDEPDPEN